MTESEQGSTASAIIKASQRSKKEKVKKGTGPLYERFDELLELMQKFCKNSHFGKVHRLRIMEVPNSGGKMYEVIGQVGCDRWAMLKRGRGFQTVFKGALRTELKRHPRLGEFFS